MYMNESVDATKFPLTHSGHSVIHNIGTWQGLSHSISYNTKGGVSYPAHVRRDKVKRGDIYPIHPTLRLEQNEV